MLTYDMTKRGKMPIYEYVYRCIRGDIEQGQLDMGEKLPSKRKLAEHLHISIITVENAYAQLLLEGYIEARERSGYYVSTESAPFLLQPQNGKRNSREERKSSERSKKETIAFDFHGNALKAETFPFSLWSKIMRQILSEQSEKLLERTPYNGIRELREAIAEHLIRYRGMKVNPDCIVVGAGTEYLYILLLQLLGANHIYGLEEPGYQKIANIYQKNHATCRFVETDEKGLSIEQLMKSDVDVVHISPSHHFPTGAVMPISRRQKLLRWADEQKGRYIIEDDYDSEFRFTGIPIPTMQSIDDGERVIYTNTFSKSIAPSIRISYMVLPRHLMEQYQKELGFYSCTVPSLEQYTLARFLKTGAFEKHLNRMRVYYKKQRNLVMDAIQRCPASRYLSIEESQAGLHFLLAIQTALTSEELQRKMSKRGIRISCLAEYYHEQENAGWMESDSCPRIIVNYSNLDMDGLDEALQILSDVI